MPRKNEMGVEAAGTIGNHTKPAFLPKVSSVFTAENHDIHLALDLA